jgi:branched-chain amino acid transport system ATP-binding protein
MTLLEVRDLQAGYGAVQVLRDIALEVGDDEIVTLLGANGAGKTTTLRALSGALPHVRGHAECAGLDLLHRRSPERAAAMGIAHVPEGRGTLTTLTVEDNLRVGAYTRRGDREGVAADLQRCYAYFPRLAERRSQRAGNLSGGEQQMLAIARALMLRPRLLLLDEPSLGLAPQLVQAIFRVIKEINAEGTTILLVEQNAQAALALADRAYVIETGSVVLEGSAGELAASEQVRKAYLGED